MKKIISVLLCAVMVFSLAGCVAKGSESTIGKDTADINNTSVNSVSPDTLTLSTGQKSEELNTDKNVLPVNVDDTKLDALSLKSFDSRDDLMAYLGDLNSSGYYGRGSMNDGIPGDDGGIDNMAKINTNLDMDVEASTSEAGMGGGSDYSETNVQVEGVDEADIVKFDSNYIYVAGSGYVVVFDKNLKEVVRIDNGDAYVSGMYVDDGVLSVVLTRWEKLENPEAKGDAKLAYWAGTDITDVKSYDVSAFPEIKQIADYSISSCLNDSRKIGDKIYVVGGYSPMRYYPIPLLKNEDNTYSSLSLDKIVYPGDESKDSKNYITLSIVDTKTGEAKEKTFVSTAYYGTVYSNKDNIIVQMNKWTEDKENTFFVRFDISDDIKVSASDKISGYVGDQFSMDIYDGIFRTATTEYDEDYDEQNYIHLFDLKTMTHISKVGPFGVGEQIKSVRFDGDMAYVTTFENTDPFFVIDLSDVKNPVIKGELKLPGFSTYMHKVGDNLVMGVGYNTNEVYTKDRHGNMELTGYTTEGIKITLFDVSNVSDPKELDSYYLDEKDYHSDALYEHKAVFVHNDVFAIPYETWENGKDNVGVMFFKVSGNKIDVVKKINLWDDKNYGANYDFWGSRIGMIGDNYYIFNNGYVASYIVDNFKFNSSIIIETPEREYNDYPITVFDNVVDIDIAEVK